MREIKFRAYILDRDHPDQKFDDDENPLIYSMTYDIAFEEYAPINDLLGGVTNLMQYTGLKDKNGKEIYESDKIKTPAGIGDVRWDAGCFCLYWNENDHIAMHDISANQMEVMGNIYED